MRSQCSLKTEITLTSLFEGDFKMKLPFTITRNSVTVVIDGMPRTVLNDTSRYDDVLSAIKSDDWEKVVSLMETPEDLSVEVLSRGEMELRDGHLHILLDEGAWWKVPSDLAKHIMSFFDQGLPYKPWVNFAKKLQKNPSYRSVQELFKFLDANNFTLTDSGNFIAYKRVQENFLDIYSGTIDNSPGTSPRVPRNEVDEDSSRTCSNGLHVAAFEYAKHKFGSSNSSNDKLVYVEVDPADVVAVPSDYENQKMRVCGYTVLGLCDYKFEEPLYGESGFYGAGSCAVDREEEWEEWDNEEDDDYDDDGYDDEEDEEWR
jgi:hypothetical protein